MQFPTGYGATETAPGALVRVRDDRPWGSVGLPLPGAALKLGPCGDAFEGEGFAVTPGYWRNAGATRAALDEEDYFRIGDALLWAADNDPAPRQPPIRHGLSSRFGVPRDDR